MLKSTILRYSRKTGNLDPVNLSVREPYTVTVPYTVTL